MAKTQIKNYIFKPGIGANDNLFPDAYNLIERNREFIKKETVAYVESEYGFASYAFDSDQLEQDVSQNLQSVLQDLRYGGNSNTFEKASQYWEQDTAQISGTRVAETETYNFVKTLIIDYILDNEEFSALNIVEEQVIDTDKSPAAEADSRVIELLDIITDVIENGLSNLPVLEKTGVGTVKLQGQFDIEDILLITNATKNEIIYNFSNPATGGSIELTANLETLENDFPSFLQTTDAITKITLNFDTSNHTVDDELQIFIEKTENGESVLRTRPYDFGTDAIERMRVATPYSMLDADFEYGLQPTKWAAIGVLRGYPSSYELPGTDTQVLNVVTDASAGTEGVGQSQITVTTVTAHGFEPGTPITIKALEDSVLGAARAEGSFVVVEVPSPNTFTYFAKSKVGDTEGTVIATSFTQLREAAFYTGADISNADIAVLSQGSAGVLQTELKVESGNNILPYDGDTPELGAPLVIANGALPTGTQVTGIISQSQGGGTFITPTLTSNAATGTNEIEVEDATGILQNLAADRGDGFATFVTSVTGNTLSFSDNFTSEIIANRLSYTGVTGINVSPSGTGAEFDISFSNDSTNSYIVDAVSNQGTGYVVGDRIIIAGVDLGGTSPENDLTVQVEAVNQADGAIDDVSIFSGAHFAGTIVFSEVEPTTTGGTGQDAVFDVSYDNGTYTAVGVPSPDFSTGYKIGDVIVIDGSVISPETGNANNSLYINVTSVGTGGAIIDVIFDGNAPDYFAEFFNVPFTTSGVGNGAVLDVEASGISYNVTIPEGDNGQDFQINDTLTVSGTDLDGSSPENNLVLTVNSVDLNGGIEDFSISGTAVNATTLSGLPGTNRIGSGAIFDITLDNGAYSVSLVGPGTGYGLNQELLISGTELAGTSPENDLTITTTDIDELASGVILDFITQGNGYVAEGVYSNVPGSNDTPTGTGGAFNIERLFDTYNSIILNSTGSGYKTGDRILIQGSQLDGENAEHDIILSVTNTVAGEINSFSADFDSAFPGTNFDLVCTVSISEFTTQDLQRLENITFSQLATLKASFDSAHGLVPGDTFVIEVTSGDVENNHDLAAGSFFASDIPSLNELTFQARAPGSIDETESILANFYPRPDSFFIHRPYDGGVQLGTGGPQHGAQAIRQSKKYIRYQSGKGIMYTTGALFAPSYDLRSVVADDVEVNSTITITTDDNDHGVQEGGIVRLLNVETPGYNSGPETAIPPEFDYEVINVLDERTFQVRSKRRLGSTTATLGFGAQMSVVSWHGATVRSGIFDDQNGIFWEYDGTQISVVQRTGTRQLAGSVSIDVDTSLLQGNNTRFRDQVKAGDRIVLKGMTHVVTNVNSQTEMTISPDWRGVVNVTGGKINLIRDKKVKQSEFNLDRLDGTGPSGYDIDIAKMQMIGIQYSWYGAGFIDFMVRGADGNFVYAHRMRNSNVNTEAFMRSGNLPVRYEVTNEGPPGKLAESMTASQDEMILTDSSFFPQSGSVYIDNEIIQFTGNNKAENKLTGLIRGAPFVNFQAGSTRSYTAGAADSHADRTGVVLISQTITPLISHWGSAFITDGQFDDDRGYIFSYAETGIEVSTTKQTAFLIRLAPSVSNALVGDLGERELLNRAQLLLQSLEITSQGVDNSGNVIQGGIVVEGILNPGNYPINPNDIGWSKLSGVAQGGQPSFAQIAAGGSVSWSTGEAATVENITAQSPITETVPTSSSRSSPSNRNYIFINTAQYESTFGTTSGSPVIGLPITGSTIRTGTTITNVYISGSYGYFRLSRNTAGRANRSSPITLSVTKGSDLQNRNFGNFTLNSVNSAGIAVGTSVTGGSAITFPANTQINSIDLRSFGDAEFYEVQFNNNYDGTLVAGTGTVEVEFVQPPFAQPGETVFSFIAQPGERATTDFTLLKELTNTPLGGRGTFPNGPDVLAVNVYKVSGSSADANIILNWGEAQA